jgi:hypothetical protein
MTGGRLTLNDEESEGRGRASGAGIQPRSGQHRLKPVRRLKVCPTTPHLDLTFRGIFRAAANEERGQCWIPPLPDGRGSVSRPGSVSMEGQF